MKQWVKIKELLRVYDIEIKADESDNVQLIVTNKNDKSIGLFEGKTFGLAIGKTHTHLKKCRRGRIKFLTQLN